eukprot:gene7100-21094_t
MEEGEEGEAAAAGARPVAPGATAEAPSPFAARSPFAAAPGALRPQRRRLLDDEGPVGVIVREAWRPGSGSGTVFPYHVRGPRGDLAWYRDGAVAVVLSGGGGDAEGRELDVFRTPRNPPRA